MVITYSGDTFKTIMQEEGLAWLTAYLRRAVAERAKEEHTALVESTSGKLSQGSRIFLGLWPTIHCMFSLKLVSPKYALVESILGALLLHQKQLIADSNPC